MSGIPDTLVNSLIRTRNGQGLRRVIRDDGPNGLWISNPNNPSQMYSLTRDEFDMNWELAMPGQNLRDEDVAAGIYGNDGRGTASVGINIMDNTNRMVREEHPMPEPRKNEAFEARSEDTDREAIKREILGQPVLDATFSGEPVGANEESVSTFEEDRAATEGDAEAAEAREEELEGSFEMHDAPMDEADMSDPDAVEVETSGPQPDEAVADEPMAGNEDPTPVEEAPAATETPKRGRKRKS